MKKNLMESIPVLKKSRLMQRYAKLAIQGGLQVDPFIWIVLSIVLAAAVALGVFVVMGTVFQAMDIVVPVLSLIVILDLMIGFPYLKGTQRLESIEKNLPDALKQMAETLKAGGTYEVALREVANSEYGPLSKEIDNVLRKLEEGENFENSLKAMGENVDSRLVRRTITIIVDSIRAGAGLAEILEDIAEDIREEYRLGLERKSRTILQVMFMIVAGVIVTPFIFGMISVIITFLIETASTSGIVTQEAATNAINVRLIITTMMEVYLFIEVIASSLMMSLMREGKMNKSIIYIPLLLFVAYVVFFISQFATNMLIGGSFTGKSGG